jgi:putative ABC transport system permease protein
MTGPVGLSRELARALRGLARTPGATAAALTALALGIGAATAMFSVADLVLIRPLPYPQADRLVTLEGQFLALGMRDIGASPPEFLDYRARARSFDAVAAFSRADRNLTGDGEPERVAAVRISPELLALLGTTPAHGRDFTPAEARPGAERVAILSWGLWKRRFGGEEGVVGRTIALDGQAYSVVGVTPRGFAFPPPGVRFHGAAEVFVPLAFSAEETTARSEYSLVVVARRRADVPAAAAAAEMTAVARALEVEHPQSYRGPGGEDGGWRLEVVPFRSAVVGGSGPSVALLFAAVVTLLVIACVDVAHLLLARGVARRRALAVKLALGASRGRLVRELVVESLALALAGGALGALAATGAIRLLVLSGADIPRLAEASVDRRALVFAIAASVLAAVLAGLGPALQATRGDLAEALADGGRTGSPGRASVRARRLLVVSELALAVLLLAGAGLLVRSFVRLRAVSPGFSADGVLSVELSLTRAASGQNERARRIALFDRLRDGVGAIRGVRVAALASRLPLTGPAFGGPFSVQGRPFDPTSATPTFAVYRAVSPEYHATLGVRILQGRGLSAGDRDGAPTVAVINEALARGFFGGGDPVGQLIKLGAPRSPRPWLTIVGVTADVRDRALALPPTPEIAVPYAQDPPEVVVILARTAGEPLAILPSVRQAVRAVDPEQPVSHVRTLDQVVAESITERRAPALLLAGFAALAVILAGLGTYGVMSYAVSGRAHEIGVRMALGARPADVARLVVGEGVRLALAGAAIGLAAAVALGRTVSALLFEVRPTDPLTYAGASLALIAVAVAACARPALRATRVDPAVALRQE